MTLDTQGVQLFIATLTDTVSKFIDEQGLGAVDTVGSSMGARIVLGWGRQDRVTLPRQAARALRAFPDAQLHWFSHCGHFPQWDAPEDAVRLIMRGTA
ncbi:MAG: alpha/beta fold hydrolase [Pseudonocardiaceae bacterium]